MTATKKLTVVKQAATKVAANSNGKQPKPNLKLVGGTDFEKQFLDLDLNLIEPGENWRKIIDTPDFSLFVENIKENGVLETILVTPADKLGIHKIIAGERRFQASKKAGLKSIPARILNLSEDKLLDAHVAENLQRKDLEPMDEAEGLAAVLKQAEKRKIPLTISELARRVGKPAEHVALRLELNKLIPEAKQDLRAGLLDVKIAERIAPFSEAQQLEIYEFCFDKEWKRGKNILDKTQPRTLRSVNDKISSQILLDLKFVPFSKTAKDLRADELTCVDCKQRTGASELLFAEMNSAKKDCCMNRECFNGKLQKHVELVQITIARKNIVNTLPKLKKGETLPEISANDINAEVARLPKLSNSYYGNDGVMIPLNDYTEIKKIKDACASAVTGIFYKGERVGKTALVCLRSSKCQTHYRTYESAAVNTKSPDDYKMNRQLLFDLRADQKTRRLVLAEAVSQFDENKTVWNDDKLRLLMLASMIQSIGHSERHRRSLIADVLGLDAKTFENGSGSATDFKIFDIYERLAALPEAVQSKIGFMLAFASFGENQYEMRGVKQTHVEFLADHLNINYIQLGAEARIELCAEKYKKQLPEAKAYLEKVQQSSESIPFPSFFYDLAAENQITENKSAELSEVPANLPELPTIEKIAA